MDEFTIKTRVRKDVRNGAIVWLPEVIEDHGKWAASWDMISWSEKEAQANLNILLKEHNPLNLPITEIK